MAVEKPSLTTLTGAGAEAGAQQALPAHGHRAARRGPEGGRLSGLWQGGAKGPKRCCKNVHSFMITCSIGFSDTLF